MAPTNAAGRSRGERPGLPAAVIGGDRAERDLGRRETGLAPTGDGRRRPRAAAADACRASRSRSATRSSARRATTARRATARGDVYVRAGRRRRVHALPAPAAATTPWTAATSWTFRRRSPAPRDGLLVLRRAARRRERRDDHASGRRRGTLRNAACRSRKPRTSRSATHRIRAHARGGRARRRGGVGRRRRRGRARRLTRARPDGPSSFDVTDDGRSCVLDGGQRPGRALVARTRRARRPSTSTAARRLRASSPTGRSTCSSRPRRDALPRSAELRPRRAQLEWRTASPTGRGPSSRVGPDGPVVQQQPSEQWLPAAETGKPLTRAEQARARTRRHAASRNGRDVVVERVSASASSALAEVVRRRVARGLADHERRRRSAKSSSPSRVGNRLVVVVKTYTDDATSSTCSSSTSQGIARRFAVRLGRVGGESAPLARFRLAGRRSTSSARRRTARSSTASTWRWHR